MLPTNKSPFSSPLDDLRKAGPSTGLGGQPSQTQQALNVFGAQTGKQAPPSGPKASNVAERTAAAAGQAGLGQVAQQASVQQQEFAQQQRATDQQEQSALAELDEQALAVQNGYLNRAQALMNEYSQGVRSLDVRKEGARLEQLGQTLRLSDAKYVHRLQTEGRKSRLQNDAKFREALQRSVFEDELSVLESDLSFRSILRADARTFEKEMARLDLNAAIALAHSSAKQAANQMAWAGGTQAVQGGLQGWDRYERDKKQKTDASESVSLGDTTEGADTTSDSRSLYSNHT